MFHLYPRIDYTQSHYVDTGVVQEIMVTLVTPLLVFKMLLINLRRTTHAHISYTHVHNAHTIGFAAHARVLLKKVTKGWFTPIITATN